MEMSFLALPSQQGPVQGRFEPAHLPISLSAKVPACVRRFETPTALNDGRTESKKDISMLTIPYNAEAKRWGHLLKRNSLAENGWLMKAAANCFT